MVKQESARTDVREAEKPEPPDSLISNIAEVSRNTKGIYFLYVGLLAFCALTVAGTSDRQIVLNLPTTLPVINVQVSMQGFFMLAPLLSIFFFVYMQIYLTKLQRLLHTLRTDYAPIKEAERLYPWMVNFAGEAGAGWATRFIVTFSIWWSLPVVLMLLALFYLKLHVFGLSIVIGLTPLLGAVLVLAFWGRGPKQDFRLAAPQRLLLGMVLLFEIVFFSFFMPKALAGEKIVPGWVWPNVDVSYQNLINKQDKAFSSLYWGNLSGAQLQGANLTGAVLQRADLRGADLRGAILTNAILRQADLRGADLREAILINANLDHARLDSARLEKADCTGASFRHAVLDSLADAVLVATDLRGADLRDANLKRANLKDAWLDSADLSFSNLAGAIFRGARLNRSVLIRVTTKESSSDTVYTSGDTTVVHTELRTDFRGSTEHEAIKLIDDIDFVRNPLRLPRAQLRVTPLDGEDGQEFLTSNMARSTVKDMKFYHYYWNRISPLDSLIKTGFERQQRGLVVVDTTNGLIWQQSGSNSLLNYVAAQEYIRSLNDSTFAGFSDWRLPTLEEAMSLLRPEQNRSLHIPSVFDGRQFWVWTSDKDRPPELVRVEDARWRWIVDLQFGICDRPRYGAFVRAVRHRW